MLETGEPKRLTLTVLVTAAFVAMLAGTSKARDDGEAEPAEAKKADAKADPEAKADGPKLLEHELTVPSTEGWTEVPLPAAGIVAAIPPGATVDPAGAGNDASFSGRYFRVRMDNGLEAFFAQNTGEPVDFAEQKRWYEHDAIGFEGYAYQAEDALVVARKDDSGEYWETTACSAPIGGKPLCAHSVGASIEGDKMLKLTHEECFAVVAIARSIREAK